MPGKTFINLKPAKQKLFIKVCLEEFALNSFRSASITGIVKKLGIAKGSVYQYFRDKNDLYKYLLELSLDKRKPFIEQVEISKKKDVWKLFELWLTCEIEFDRQNPQFSLLLLNCLREKFTEEVSGFMDFVDGQQREIVELIISKGRKSNSLQTDFNPELILDHLISSRWTLSERLLNVKDKEINKMVRRNSDIKSISDKMISDEVKETIHLLKSGLGIPASGSQLRLF